MDDRIDHEAWTVEVSGKAMVEHEATLSEAVVALGYTRLATVERECSRQKAASTSRQGYRQQKAAFFVAPE